MSNVLQVAGWAVLPDLVTRHALSFIHQTVFKFLNYKPPLHGSPAYVQHYRYTYAVVVLGYLLYNFLEATTALPKNYYELLGVLPDTADSALKTAFRAFARKNHPDRVGPEGEAYFIQVRDAFEALRDPVVRFAYDRFGPDVLQWKECHTMKEYLRRGLLSSSTYHVITGAGLVLFSMVGKRSPIAAWRYLLFVAMFAVEFYLLLAPPSKATESSPFADHIPFHRTILDRLFPYRVTHQHVRLLRQIFFFVSAALSRVAPVLVPSLMRNDPAAELRMLKVVAERLDMLTKSTEQEIAIMQNLTLHAVQSDPSKSGTSIMESPQKIDEDMLRTLSTAMEDIIIESKLRSETGPMKSAWERAVERGKQGMALEVGGRIGGGAPSQEKVLGGRTDLRGRKRPRPRSISL